ncbi:MAG: zinc-dependent peptidase [Gemmatimonadales bacterium]|nr:zinc-dependent peptidase [Gemmatimonadales bacterium]
MDPRIASAAKPPTNPSGLGTAAERHAMIIAVVSTALVLVSGIVVLVGFHPTGGLRLTVFLTMAVGAWLAWSHSLRKVRRRKRILAAPFPVEWETVLLRDVAFFRALPAADRLRFRNELKIFLGEKTITGIRTAIDTRTRVLVGASAVIPIFGFPRWEWDQINEVLVYPARFGDDFSLGGDGGNQNILGMVGTGAMNRIMILVKPDLIQGFKNAGDKRNVGVHEFAHLVDKSDGVIDGMPGVGLSREVTGPWIELVRRKMQEISDGESDINDYALTNEAEFFSVVSEYFFERPDLMEQKHPELFSMMQKVFRQDLKSRLQDIRREMSAGQKKFGRNSPCPCGSGIKYKKCCLSKME